MSLSRQIPTKTLEQKHVHTNHNSMLVVEGCHDFECSINRHATKVVCWRSEMQFDLQDILQSLSLKQKKHENGSQQIFSCQHMAPSYN